MSLQVDLNVIYRIVKRVSFEGVFCQMPLFLSILDTQAKKRFGIRGGLGECGVNVPLMFRSIAAL